MFRLGSIEGEEVAKEDEAAEKFREAIIDENLAVLIITKTVESWIPGLVKDHKESENIPLIVVIDG